jgi:Ca-activated chloride channel family protein
MDGVGYVLNQRIDPADPYFSDLRMYFASGINDAGQIVTYGHSALTPENSILPSGSAYLLTPVATAVTLSAPTSVAPGQPVTLQWNAPASRASHTGDWVGFYRADDPNWANDPDRWTYTQGNTTGSLSINAPSTPGQYEFRYLLDAGYDTVAATLVITVSEAGNPGGYQLIAPSTVTAGEPVTLQWIAPASRAGHTGDWIGFYRVGDPDWANDPDRWTYTEGITTGYLWINAPTTPGQYEFRYLLDGEYHSVASQRLTVLP